MRSASELVLAGFKEHQAGSWATARAAYRQGLALAPAHAEALHLLGAIAHQTGHSRNAIPWMERAIAISPDAAVFHANLADALKDSGFMERAIGHLSMATRLDAEPIEPRLALASLLRVTGRRKESAVASVDADLAALPPVRIRIETASACNLRCQHCPTGVSYGATERTVMKLAAFDRLIAQMSAIPSLQNAVMYLGGEPLLNKHLALMCRRLKAETHVTRTVFVTNAMLLTEANCAALAVAAIDQIDISVDGRSPDENDRIRLGADFWVIKRNVAMLRRHLEGTQTRVVITNVTLRRAGDPDDPQPPEFIAEHFPGLECLAHYAMVWPGLDMELSDLPDSRLGRREPERFCAMPFYEISVRANGDALLCCYDLGAEQVMGNVFETDILTVWNSQPYRDLRRTMIAGHVDRLPQVCQKCVVYTGKMIAH